MGSGLLACLFYEEERGKGKSDSPLSITMALEAAVVLLRSYPPGCGVRYPLNGGSRAVYILGGGFAAFFSEISAGTRVRMRVLVEEIVIAIEDLIVLSSLEVDGSNLSFHMMGM